MAVRQWHEVNGVLVYKHLLEELYENGFVQEIIGTNP